MENINRDMKILIVDDSGAMRRIVTKFLNNNEFFNLIEAGDGMKALAFVQNEPIGLIIYIVKPIAENLFIDEMIRVITDKPYPVV